MCVFGAYFLNFITLLFSVAVSHDQCKISLTLWDDNPLTLCLKLYPFSDLITGYKLHISNFYLKVQALDMPSYGNVIIKVFLFVCYCCH